MRPNLAIDPDRLLSRIDALAEIGATGDGGCRRLALSDEDRQGRDFLVALMHGLGLDVRVDPIGNIFGVLPGASDTAPVMVGSHIDTVATGGRYDGALGVLAGLEVAETLREAGIRPARPLVVAAFTNEEGTRYQPDMMGSLVHVGGLGLDEARAVVGTDGTRLGEELDRIGYAGDTALGGIRPHAFVELHIEQGPVLDREGGVIGAVEAVQGISWSDVEILGEANHAGTTPMRLRKDAGLAAARIALFACALAQEIDGQVATVGRIELEPNAINVVPGRARLTVDLRNPNEDRLAAAEARLAGFVDGLAEETGLDMSRRSLARFDPVRFDPGIVAVIESAAASLGLPVRRMTSGAGHDAQMLARICPTAMIFVPSMGGLSHNPAEHTEPEHLAAGANVLLQTVLALAAQA